MQQNIVLQMNINLKVGNGIKRKGIYTLVRIRNAHTMKFLNMSINISQKLPQQK